jgi:hypothetical protein
VYRLDGHVVVSELELGFNGTAGVSSYRQLRLVNHGDCADALWQVQCLPFSYTLASFGKRNLVVER